MIDFKTAALALTLAYAGPALAQTALPPPPSGMGSMGGGMEAMGGHGKMGAGHRMDREDMMFGSLSPAGQKIMGDAMRPSDPKADHEAMKAARDKVLTVLDADKLDAAALKRAMDDERAASEAMRSKRQAAMAAAFAKLTTADRKSFVANARVMRDRMESRMQKMHDRMGKHGGMDGMDMPPPPPKP